MLIMIGHCAREGERESDGIGSASACRRRAAERASALCSSMISAQQVWTRAELTKQIVNRNSQ